MYYKEITSVKELSSTPLNSEHLRLRSINVIPDKLLQAFCAKIQNSQQLKKISLGYNLFNRLNQNSILLTSVNNLINSRKGSFKKARTYTFQQFYKLNTEDNEFTISLWSMQNNEENAEAIIELRKQNPNIKFEISPQLERKINDLEKQTLAKLDITKDSDIIHGMTPGYEDDLDDDIIQMPIFVSETDEVLLKNNKLSKALTPQVGGLVYQEDTSIEDVDFTPDPTSQDYIFEEDEISLIKSEEIARKPSLDTSSEEDAKEQLNMINARSRMIDNLNIINNFLNVKKVKSLVENIANGKDLQEMINLVMPEIIKDLKKTKNDNVVELYIINYVLNTVLYNKSLLIDIENLTDNNFAKILIKIEEDLDSKEIKFFQNYVDGSNSDNIYKTLKALFALRLLIEEYSELHNIASYKFFQEVERHIYSYFHKGQWQEFERMFICEAMQHAREGMLISLFAKSHNIMARNLLEQAISMAKDVSSIKDVGSDILIEDIQNILIKFNDRDTDLNDRLVLERFMEVVLITQHQLEEQKNIQKLKEGIAAKITTAISFLVNDHNSDHPLNIEIGMYVNSLLYDSHNFVEINKKYAEFLKNYAIRSKDFIEIKTFINNLRQYPQNIYNLFRLQGEQFEALLQKHDLSASNLSAQTKIDIKCTIIQSIRSNLLLKGILQDKKERENMCIQLGQFWTEYPKFSHLIQNILDVLGVDYKNSRDNLIKQLKSLSQDKNLSQDKKLILLFNLEMLMQEMHLKIQEQQNIISATKEFITLEVDHETQESSYEPGKRNSLIEFKDKIVEILSSPKDQDRIQTLSVLPRN